MIHRGIQPLMQKLKERRIKFKLKVLKLPLREEEAIILLKI